MTSLRVVPQAPRDFYGTIATLTREALTSVMPAPEAVTKIHEHLKVYCEQERPLFLIRYERLGDRRKIVPSATFDVCWTDNSPAWEMHHAAFQHAQWTTAEFDQFVRSMPSHMFDARNTGINTAKWYVAHIFPVKADPSIRRLGTRQEHVARFIRNVHPANHFYFPNPMRGVGQRWGEDPRVIQYVAAYYRDRYAAIWPEFLTLVTANDSKAEKTAGTDFHVHFSATVEAEARAPRDEIAQPKQHAAQGDRNLADGGERAASRTGNLARPINEAALTAGFLNWTGNDNSARNHNGAVRKRSQIDLMLRWKQSSSSPAKFIGCFRFDLAALFRLGYIRQDSRPECYRVRLYHAEDDFIYIQASSDGPFLRLARFADDNAK